MRGRKEEAALPLPLPSPQHGVLVARELADEAVRARLLAVARQREAQSDAADGLLVLRVVRLQQWQAQQAQVQRSRERGESS